MDPGFEQVYDDVPMLGSYIDTELRIGLDQAEENEILLGAGTTGHMNGLYTQRTAYSATGIPTGPTVVDHIRWAKLQVRKSYFPATAVVLNPEDSALYRGLLCRLEGLWLGVENLICSSVDVGGDGFLK